MTFGFDPIAMSCSNCGLAISEAETCRVVEEFVIGTSLHLAAEPAAEPTAEGNLPSCSLVFRNNSVLFSLQE